MNFQNSKFGFSQKQPNRLGENVASTQTRKIIETKHISTTSQKWWFGGVIGKKVKTNHVGLIKC